MECAKCGISVFSRPLKRVNQKGEKGIWWCEVCLLKNEPELYKNQIDDESLVEKTLKNICYEKKN